MQQRGKGEAKMVVEGFASAVLLRPDDEASGDDPGHHVWISYHLLVSDTLVVNSMSAILTISQDSPDTSGSTSNRPNQVERV